MDNAKRARAEAVMLLVHQGWKPPTPTDQVFDRIVEDIAAADPTLSPTQQQIVGLYRRGHRPKEIAGMLDMGLWAVDEHLRRAVRKLGLSSRRELLQ